MDFEKKNNIYKIVMTVIVTVIITFIATSVFMYNYYLKTGKGLVTTLFKSEPTDLDKKIELIKLYIDKYYLGDINEENMEEWAIKGYVAGLGDKYTEYLTKDEYEELMVEVNGNYVGIGIYMAQDKAGNIVILKPFEGSPAEQAGLKTGDIILKVDGQECNGMNLELIANKVKGDEGTTVELEIKRDEQIINKTIQRSLIRINNIKSEIIENNIGYMQVLSFDDGVYNRFEECLNELLNKNIKSLIIDIRDNGGGIVTEVTNIADLFLDQNSCIMIEKNKNGEEEYIDAKNNATVSKEIKVIILANENTASASEILMGALRDNNIASIIGTKTYGKGVMQEIVPVSSGGALKVTIKEFYTPNGNKIDENGIIPDIEIEDSKTTQKDEQLEMAIKQLKK